MGTVTRTGRGRETGLRGRARQCGGIGNGRGEVRGNTDPEDPGAGPELHLEGEIMTHRIAGGGMGTPGGDLLFSVWITCSHLCLGIMYNYFHDSYTQDESAFIPAGDLW